MRKILYFIGLISTSVFATTWGPNTVGTGVDDASIGTSVWSNPTNITTSDDAYANATTVSATSHFLKGTNLSFSVTPSTAIIRGIVVEFERKFQGAAGTVTDSTIQLVVNGSTVGENKSAGALWSPTESFVSFGSSTDLWGSTNTISAADINGSGFGAVISVVCTGAVAVASADSVRVTVYSYTPQKSIQVNGSESLTGGIQMIGVDPK